MSQALTLIPESRVPTLSKAKGEELIEKCKAGLADWAGALLDLFNGKAHKTFGYADFNEFAADRLNINVSERTINNWLVKARVDRQLRVAAEAAQKAATEAITEGEGEAQGEEGNDGKSATVALSVPLNVALEINRVDKAKWPEIFAEFQATSTAKTQAEQARHIGRIVKRYLPDNKPNAAAVLAKKNRMEPVVADTYDGSEEQKAAEEAQQNGNAPTLHTPSEIVATPVRASEEAANGISITEYGVALGFCRRLVQVYGSDGQALAELVAEVESFLKEKDGRG